MKNIIRNVILMFAFAIMVLGSMPGMTVYAEEGVPEEAPAVDPEYDLFLRLVEAEASGEDINGKLLVANVVMNRLRSESFPGTITEVINDAGQFSPVSSGKINRVNVSAETVDAVNRAMAGEDISQGALYFRSIHSGSQWFDQSLTRIIEYGNHYFYL